MTENENFGYLVVRRDRPKDEPWAVGDPVHVYPLLEHLDLSDVDPDYEPLSDDSFDPHRAAITAGPLIESMRTNLREVGRVNCRCASKGKKGKPQRYLAIALANTVDGRIWVLIRPENLPAAHREHLVKPSSAWPMHCEPNGAPHVQLTTCSNCRQHSAIFLTASTWGGVALGRPTLSSQVAE